MATPGDMTVQPLPAPLVSPSAAWDAMAKQTVVDLSRGPSTPCSLALAALPAVGDQTFRVALLGGTAAQMIALCQQAMGRVISAMIGRAWSVPVTGVYDCVTAANMVIVADLVRDGLPGAAPLWPLGLREMRYLVASSEWLNRQVQDTFSGDVQGVLPIDPSYFAPASPPGACNIPTGAWTGSGEPFGTLSGPSQTRAARPYAAGGTAFAGLTQERGYHYG